MIVSIVVIIVVVAIKRILAAKLARAATNNAAAERCTELLLNKIFYATLNVVPLNLPQIIKEELWDASRPVGSSW